MGAGTNKINIYTIGMATQGLANYINEQFNGEEVAVAIAHDSRNNSALFARTTAEVFAGNGITVHLFDSLRPTPELSFALRELGCKAGVVITASHNPPEYNGYKVYWSDGGQLVPPHDKNVIEKVRAIDDPLSVKRDTSGATIFSLGTDMDAKYLAAIESLSFTQDRSIHENIRVVYTAIHGTGTTVIPAALQKLGFSDVHQVEEQAAPDGNFPTVQSPNPEEIAALDLAIQLANKIEADVVLGTDPDSDRVGMVVRDSNNELAILNGNQAGSLLVWYLLNQWKEGGQLDGKQFVAKTVVTTELIREMAKGFDVDCYDTLTGFKYIAELIRNQEGKQQFIGGGEESYGYLAGDFVRDKDAVISTVLLCEAAAWAKAKGSSLMNELTEIYTQFGLYEERLISVTKKGRTGAEEIGQMMENFRTHPPQSMGGSAVVRIIDHKFSQDKDLVANSVSDTQLPSSNVIQFFLENGSKVTARPSGTEPKIKFYFSVKGILGNGANYPSEKSRLTQVVDSIVAELGLN